MSETEFIIEPGRQDIVMRRVFDAPRELVFRACTDPEILARWWGPDGYDVTIDRYEAEAGGTWRIVHGDTEGGEHGFRGVHHDVVAPERIVRTFEYEGAPGHVSLETLTLEETDGQTTYVAQSVAQSVEARDAMVESGMQEGAAETMDRLAEILADLG